MGGILRIVRTAAITSSFLFGLAACGGEEPSNPAGDGDAAVPAEKSGAPGARGKTEPVVVDPSTAGVIRGSVRFEGTPPKLPPLPMQADPICHRKSGGKPAPDEVVVVNANGTLRNVFVQVARGLPEGRFDPPAEPALLDQSGCKYEPRVLGIQTGQTLVVRNSDETNHNIHGYPKKNDSMNFGQATAGMEDRRVFEYAELIPVKCDRHPWMQGYIHVMKHPYFAVTRDEGSFELANLPPGTYTIEAWHERYGRQSLEVTLAASAAESADFTFQEE